MPLNIAVTGCGPGGASVAKMLQQAGHTVTLYEQAPAFLRIGAGIHLTPNLMRVMAGIGLADELIAAASLPETFTSRDAHSNQIIAELALRADTPYLTIHRGDFHAALVRALHPGSVRFGKKLQGLTQTAEEVRLRFTDGSEARADLAIGADGLASVVRNSLADCSPPTFAGQVAYRATVDLTQPGVPAPPEKLTKWWSASRFVIGYYLRPQRDEYYIVAGVPASQWQAGVPFTPATTAEMLAEFADFHPAVHGLLAAADHPTRWPLYERPADQAWGKGRVVLLGDACHPMRPHMAQGAAMAIEDAAVLTRCLNEADSSTLPRAFARYQRTREARVAKVQHISGENSWMRAPTDPEWVFSYDAWNTPLQG